MTTSEKKQKPKQPPRVTPKRLFFDMMDAANASGMPCDRINAVHDAVRELADSIKRLIECPDYRGISTHEMSNACKAHHEWNGGQHEE